jgi:hypothetical protein
MEDKMNKKIVAICVVMMACGAALFAQAGESGGKSRVFSARDLAVRF